MKWCLYGASGMIILEVVGAIERYPGWTCNRNDEDPRYLTLTFLGSPP